MRMDAPPEPEPVPFGELSYSEEIPLEPEAIMAEAAPPARRPALAMAGGEGVAQRRESGRAAAAAAGSDVRERGGERGASVRPPWAGTGRNAPCPCGSGRKYKHCHGRL
jgi:preprotein translocase subunit SecA